MSIGGLGEIRFVKGAVREETISQLGEDFRLDFQSLE